MNPVFQLVRCPVDDQAVAADQWNMPLDLLLVADAIDARCEIEILDGSILSFSQLLDRIDPKAACIGLSYSALSAGSLARLASFCKENGSMIIVGGQPAIAAAESLVREDMIDAVCLGDGQPTVKSLSEQLVNGAVDLSKVPNIVFMDKGCLIRTDISHEDIWNQRLPIRSNWGLSPESYLSRYRATNTLSNMTGSRATNLYSKRGCGRGCSFCARQDKLVRLRKPSLVLDEIEYLRENFGVNYILDTSDTWIHLDWMERFRTEREDRGLSKVEMMVFADARDLQKTDATLLSSCGVDSVLLGIESGCERILTLNNKTIPKAGIFRAVDNLVSAGIKVSCSFVVGLLGENEDTLLETIEVAEELHQRPNVLCYGNVIMPLPGSRLWQASFPSEVHWPSFITRALDYDLPLVRELYVSTALDIPSVTTLEDACLSILKTSSLPVKEYAR